MMTTRHAALACVRASHLSALTSLAAAIVIIAYHQRTRQQAQECSH